MKPVAPTPTNPYYAKTVELQCNWVIPELAIKILQHLYYREIASFSSSCKQIHQITSAESFWTNLADTVFSSNEAPEKLNSRRKFKIYSNLTQNWYCQKSIEFKDCNTTILMFLNFSTSLRSKEPFPL